MHNQSSKNSSKTSRIEVTGNNIKVNGEKVLNPKVEDLKGGILSVGNGSVETNLKERGISTGIKITGNKIRINGRKIINPEEDSKGGLVSVGNGSIEINITDNTISNRVIEVTGNRIKFSGEKIISPKEEDLKGGMLSVGNGSVEIDAKEKDSQIEIEVSGNNIRINGKANAENSEGRIISVGNGSVELNVKEGELSNTKIEVSGNNIHINGQVIINPKEEDSEGSIISVGNGSVEIKVKESNVKIDVSGHSIQINGKKIIVPTEEDLKGGIISVEHGSVNIVGKLYDMRKFITKSPKEGEGSSPSDETDISSDDDLRNYCLIRVKNLEVIGGHRGDKYLIINGEKIAIPKEDRQGSGVSIVNGVVKVNGKKIYPKDGSSVNETESSEDEERVYVKHYSFSCCSIL